jgi:predicted metal-dependent hydrolase
VSAIGPALRRGAELFDAGRFLEAHETWEEEWRGLARPSAAARLLQGLAQCAAAAHKHDRGELRGARSLARKGAASVQSALEDESVRATGLALAEFAEVMRQVFEGDAPLEAMVPRLLTKDG